jgi:hypothetical protein
MKGAIFVFILVMFSLTLTLGQESNVKVNSEGKAFTSLKHAWTAQWITHPWESTLEYGVFQK